MNGRSRSLAARLLSGMEETFDRLRQPGDPAGGVRDARIAAYDGYGTTEAVTVLGRVLRGTVPDPGRADASSWENLVATYRRFGTDEVAGARVRIRIDGNERDVVTDRAGHFACRLSLTRPLPAGSTWHEATYSLVEPAPREEPVTARARIHIPAATAALGVISDIDDTVVRTDVQQFIRMVRSVVFGNSRTRLPFPGVASFYRALQAGHGASGPNPMFYVSSSPWNLYELLAEFFELQQLPRGPLLLRDWGPGSGDNLTRGGSHKQRAIRAILAEYPELPFILIGDSGQDDPEIYASIVRDHPRRIRAIHIRDVTLTERRRTSIQGLAAEVERHGCTLLLAADSLGAARHATDQGWMDPGALVGIAEEVSMDGPAGPG